MIVVFIAKQSDLISSVADLIFISYTSLGGTVIFRWQNLTPIESFKLPVRLFFQNLILSVAWKDLILLH